MFGYFTTLCMKRLKSFYIIMTTIKILTNGPNYFCTTQFIEISDLVTCLCCAVWYLYLVFIVFIFAFCWFLQEYFFYLKLQMKTKFQTFSFIQNFLKINCNVSNRELEKLMFNFENPLKNYQGRLNLSIRMLCLLAFSQSSYVIVKLKAW